MWFLYLLSWVSTFLQICFITLSVAAGLYYMAELVEEYTVMTGKLIRYIIMITTAAYIGLFLFEELPISLIGAGLIGNGVYYLLLQTFPYIELSSPTLLASIAMIFINHYLAFSYFSSVWHPFSEVLAFFTICLWLAPFTFFVSLSANENVLPTTAAEMPASSPDEDGGDIVTNYFKKKSRKIGLLSFLKTAQESILPQRVKKNY